MRKENRKLAHGTNAIPAIWHRKDYNYYYSYYYYFFSSPPAQSRRQEN